MSLFVSKPSTNFLTWRFYAKLIARPVRFFVAIVLITILNLLYQLNYDDWSVLFEVTLWNPTWLLMGPLLLMAKHDQEDKPHNIRAVFCHSIPFLLITVFFIVTTFQRIFNTVFAEQFYQAYQYSYVLIPISLATYAWLTFYSLRKKMADLASVDDLLLVICGFYAMIAAISAHLFICWGVWKVDMVIDYRIFIYALSLAMVALIVYYIGTRKNIMVAQTKVAVANTVS